MTEAPPQSVPVLIEAAATAANRGDRKQALVALLAVWAQSPSVAVAEAIEACCPAPGVAALTGKTTAACAAWDTMEARRDPVDLPALLATLATASAPEARNRIGKLAAYWPPDPRIDAALFELVVDVPYTYYPSRSFWVALLELVSTGRDPRVKASFEAARLGFNRFGSGFRDALIRRLDKTIAELHERFANPPALPREQREALEQITVALAKRRGKTTGTRSGDAILAAIFDDPEADDARLVYADFLQQRQQPHGELIAIQLGTRDAAARKREKALLDEHVATFLGPLHDVINRKGLRFARGFVERCAIGEMCNEQIGNPWWSTVRELDGGAPSLVLDPVMKNLRSLVLYHQCWRGLAAGPLHALRVLDCQLPLLPARPGDWDAEVAALGSGTNLPALRELSIVVAGAYAGWRPRIGDYAPIVQGPIAKQLERLRIECFRSPQDQGGYTARAIGPWLNELRRMKLAVPVLELDDGIRSAPVVYRFERDDNGYRLRAIETRLGREPDGSLIAILCDHLGSLAVTDVGDVAFTFGGGMPAAGRAQIAAAMQRFDVETTGLTV